MAEYESNIDTSTNVVNLRGEEVTTDEEPEESLVLMLEELLENAKLGKLRSFDGIGFLSNGARIQVRGPTYYNLIEVIGALEYLKVILMRELDS